MLMKIKLGKSSKMPCHDWSISAKRCITGSKLRSVQGSICEKCYALKGRCVFPNVLNADEERLAQYTENPDKWVNAMALQIRDLRNPYFRWFVRGDLQSVEMLADICRVAALVPEVKFWLPTKELQFVSTYWERVGAFPPNLNIRLSAYMVGKTGPLAMAKGIGQTVSEVRSVGASCPSSLQNNECRDCRLCWDKKAFVVSYKLH